MKTTLKQQYKKVSGARIFADYDRYILIIDLQISDCKVTYKCNSDKVPQKMLHKDVISEHNEKINLTLKEVTSEQLKKYRNGKIPSLVYKTKGRLYYTALPIGVDLYKRIGGTHMCAHCEHITSAEDEDGGCAKVRDGAVGIEKYPWIIEGYETFNSRQQSYAESFVVLQCLHHEKCKPRKKRSAAEVNRIRASLASFVRA